MLLKKSTGFVIAFLLVMSPVLLWAQASYPDEIDAIVKQYPGTNVLASVMTNDETNAILNMGGGSPKEALDYYKQAVTDAGWNKESEMEIGPTKALEFKKDDLKFVVTIMDQGGQLMITLALDKH